MASKTIYTATRQVPIYAGWRCQCCNSVNFSDGSLIYKAQTQSASWSTAKQNEVRSRASSLVDSIWIENSVKILLNPRNNIDSLLTNLLLYQTKCKICKKKPKWYQHKTFQILFSMQMFAIIPAIISGLIAIFSLFGGTFAYKSWIWFIISLSIFLSPFILDRIYKKTIKEMQDYYFPVFGSQNPELVLQASQKNQKMPNPIEVLELVSKREINVSKKTDTVKKEYITDYSEHEPVSPIVCKTPGYVECPLCQNMQKEGLQKCKRCNVPMIIQLENNTLLSQSDSADNSPCNNTSVTSLFCRKCGAALPEDSEFCYKCGIKVFKE